jgi:hypothetical protein
MLIADILAIKPMTAGQGADKHILEMQKRKIEL